MSAAIDGAYDTATASNRPGDAPEDPVSNEVDTGPSRSQGSGKEDEPEPDRAAENARLVQTPLFRERAEEVRKRENVKLASAKLLTILWKREGQRIEVEKSSVYGSSLLLPQVARSAGWPQELVFLVIRSYILLAVAIALQTYLVFMINKEEAVLDTYAGQQYLCDMGRNIAECPDGPGCMGPGGTLYTAERLYSWNAFVTRTFAKQGLMAMFPGKADEIEEKVDPGEFGVESHWCRILGCFLFVTCLTSEIRAIINFARLLIKLPSDARSWISYELPNKGFPDKTDPYQAKQMLDMQELDCIKIQMAGMPLAWKFVNVVLLLVPKVIVFFVTLHGGTNFLMETAGIDDGIVNSTALAFILNIDEIVYDALTNNFTRCMVDKSEAYEIQGTETEEDEEYDDSSALRAFEKTRMRWPAFFQGIFPAHLLISVFMTTYGVGFYYYKNCQMTKDGTWVSKSMYLPQSESFNLLQAFLPSIFSIPHTSTPYWEYSG